MICHGSVPFVLQVIERHYARSLGVYHEGLARREGGNTTEEEEASDPSVVMYWSLSVAIFSIGGMVSSFLVSFVSDFRGRWSICELGNYYLR